MSRESIRNPLVAGALAGALTMAGSLALNAGQTAEAAASACPSAAALEAGRPYTAACHNAALNILDHSVYWEGNKPLEVATYQKVAGLGVDGALGPKTAASILRGIAVRPKSPRPYGNKFLVNKQDQLGYDIVDGFLKHIVSVSTGTEKPYADKSKIDGHIIKGVAHTPTGSWLVNRAEGVNYKAPLGPMPYARFFTGGIAVHADPTSISGRGSHGCIRVDESVITLLIKDIHLGTKVEVVDKL